MDKIKFLKILGKWPRYSQVVAIHVPPFITIHFMPLNEEHVYLSFICVSNFPHLLKETYSRLKKTVFGHLLRLISVCRYICDKHTSYF